MIKIKSIVWIIIGLAFSSPILANNERPITCKDFHSPLEVKQQIILLDQKFQWDNPGCKIVGTKSIFPRKDKNRIIQFKNGLQLFIYQNNQLKFICLPGWVCKSWE